MNIAIDGSALCARDGGRGAGIEHYAWSLVSALIRCNPDDAFVIFVSKEFPDAFARELVGDATNVRLVRPLLPRVQFLSRHLFLPLRVRLAQPDVFFSPTGSLPLLPSVPSVMTVHDTAIFTHPEWFPSNQGFSTRIVVPRSMKTARRIVAVSEATRLALATSFPHAEGKTHTVYEGVSVPEEISRMHRFEGAEDTVLFLGTVEPRKNLVHAVAGFFEFLRAHPERARTTRFVLAGKWGWETADVAEAIEQTNHAWRNHVPEGVVRVIGYVTEEEKWALLTDASVLLFPSYDEGFGLPVLEAMAVGTPVITSDRGSLPEVGGDAALYVDPEDVERMALSIAQCLLVPEGAQSLAAAGRERAAQFTWERAAHETRAVFDEVIREDEKTA